ncbi:hypothetical protein AcW1_006381 [Taiwanofungus camphoratus]|nr:hypothetical protein AcW1_006381 [Antrodia cinnamomea]
MGRPLFSHSHQAPAVRVEPEHAQPTYEKWTYWNAFDPDSDEFFENDDAVYEAFIDAAHLQLHEGEDRRTMVVEDNMSSSEGSSSGRGSPMDESEGLSVEEIDMELRRQASWMRVQLQSGETEEDQGTRRATAGSPGPPQVVDVPMPSQAALHTQNQPREVVSTYLDSTIASMLAMREIAYPLPPNPVATSYVRSPVPSNVDRLSRSPSPALDSIADPFPPSPEPAFSPRARGVAAPQPSTPERPSTPPIQTASFYSSPSPPPTVTPRLYSWSSRNLPRTATTFYPPSPVTSGPLTNRSARLSVAHIRSAPSLIPAQHVV